MKTSDILKIIIGVVVGGIILLVLVNAYNDYQARQQANRDLLWLQMNM